MKTKSPVFGQAEHRMKWITLEVRFAEVLGRTLWGLSNDAPTSSGHAGEHDGRFCPPVNFRTAPD